MVRVVYIAGDGRSGTTVLSQILGSYDGCLAVGELYDFWIESLAGDRLCSCGAPLRDCPFWNRVMDEAFGGFDRSFIQHAIELRGSVQRMHQLPFMVFNGIRPGEFEENLREYAAILERLYTTIQNVSGCEVIVDSSKLAGYALALNESPSIKVSLVHLSRDSRACVYSWRRLKREPLADNKERYLRQRAMSQVAVVWTIRNITVASIANRFEKSVMVRYEDFVRRPRETAGQLAASLDLHGHDNLWRSENEIELSGSSHIFAGNPIRTTGGRIQVRADDEWRTKMPAWRRGLVFAVTLPGLVRMGYVGSRQSGRGLEQEVTKGLRTG